MLAAEHRQQAIAENLANLDVPGFRRLIARLEQTPAAPAATAKHYRGVEVKQIARDFQPGAIQTTDNPLDVALDGDGFFVVEGPRGPLYTRAGVMQIDSEGRLVTNSGFPFQGVEPLPLGTAANQITVQPDGSVFVNKQSVGQLTIVRFRQPDKLRPVGVVYFEATNGVASETSTANVRQGQREGSNVNASEELIQMIVGLRHHEASQRALRAISDAIAEHARIR
jgi:flagellar basal body rod protein FlgG